jgi:hypothetical protein
MELINVISETNVENVREMHKNWAIFSMLQYWGEVSYTYVREVGQTLSKKSFSSWKLAARF